MAKFPDGWILGRVGVWGELDQRGRAFAGWAVSCQDYRTASDELACRVEDCLRALQRSLDPTVRLQWQWSLSSDYSAELAAYAAETATCDNPFARSVREARHARLADLASRGLLRRERLEVFFSVPITARVPEPGLSRRVLEDHYGRTLEQLDGQFALRGQSLESFLGPVGVKVKRLDQSELFSSLWRAFNPTRSDAVPAWNPELNILPQLMREPMLGEPQREREGRYGFILDGCYHSVIGFGKDRYPQGTHAGMIYQLLTLGIREFRLAVNIYPIAQKAEVDREEYELRRVTGDFHAEQRHSLVPTIMQKRERLARLASGAEMPCRFDFGVVLWSDDARELRERIDLVRSRIAMMSGAQDYTASSFRTAKNSWVNLLPGHLWSGYQDDSHKGTDSWVANLLPLSSSFTGRLDEPDALVEGTEGQLVGIQTFIGSVPQHAVVLGSTRSGKSVTMADLICESWPRYRHTVIIEEGDSYGDVVRALGGSRVLVHQDAPVCLNPLDTYGAPLSNVQIEMASLVIAGLIKADADRAAMAAIVNAVRGEYDALAEDWFRFDESRREVCGREALCALLLSRQVLDGEGFPEALATMRDWLAEPGDNPAREIFSRVGTKEIADFLGSSEGQRLTRDVAFTRIPQDEQVELGNVVSHLRMSGTATDAGLSRNLAAELEQWCDVRLFAGQSTLRLTDRLIQFELGKADERIKAAMVLTLGNSVRNHLMTLPRSEKKMVILEEAARLLNSPAGAKLVAEYYQQLGKYNVWVCSVSQMYSTFASSAIKSPVIGNTKTYLLLRQQSEDDVRDLNAAVPLPEAAQAAILRYPMPEFTSPPHSLFCLRQIAEEGHLVGTCRLQAEEELLRLSSSRGEDYEARRRERLESLRGKPIDVEAVITGVGTR